MKTIILTLILTLVFGSFNFTNAQANRQIKVPIDRQKTVPGSKLTIKFASLLEDSRCPVGSNCIAAGQARIIINVSKSNGTAQTFELSTNSSAQSISFAGYQIKLIDLNAGAATNINNGYAATFAISRAVNSK